MATYRSIDIADLELDLGNYRIKPQPDERTAIRELINVQGHKLATLAKDILTLGVSPFDLTLVYPKEDNPKLYTVQEGNRRVAAVKCIHEPELAAETSLEKVFAELNKQSDQAPYEFYCAVAANRGEGHEFVRRKHDTGMDGAGTEPWSAIMKERFAADQGRPTATHHALEFVAKNPALGADVRRSVEGHKFPITTLRRVLESTARVKTDLGLEIDEKTGSFLTRSDKAWVMGILTTIVTAIARGKWDGEDFNVRSIIDKESREQFFKQVLSQHPKPSKKTAEWAVNIGAEIPPTAATAGQKRVRLTPHTLERRPLIPSDFKLKLASGKANDVYDELRKLEVARFNNAVGILFRVFVEFSAESYMKRKSVTAKNDRLQEKLKAVIKDMERRGVLTPKEMVKITQMTTDPKSLVSTYTLNQYVHSQELIPGPQDLKASWSSVQAFIERCWTA